MPTNINGINKIIKTERIHILLLCLLPILSLAFYSFKRVAATYRPTFECSFDSTTAVEDLKSGKAKIFCLGGIAPAAYTSQDQAFERKYLVTYYQMGCTPMPSKCINGYNGIIARHLDAKYGSIWRTQVRKDAVALLPPIALISRLQQ